MMTEESTLTSHFLADKGIHQRLLVFRQKDKVLEQTEVHIHKFTLITLLPYLYNDLPLRLPPQQPS